MTDWQARLEPFGADRQALHTLDADGPELLPYATLTNARRDSGSILGVVGAVYEWQDAPLVFLVDADQIDGNAPIHRLRRLLAMRGDAPYLGIVAPGRLDVYTIALDRKTPAQARVAIDGSSETIKDLFPHLANRRPRAARTRQGWISNVVLNLLTDAIDRLIGLKLDHGDAISLVGRALFARFLGDRDLLPSNLAAPEAAAALFDNPDNARATCAWLDDTFNGDLLPLTDDIFDDLPPDAYHVLGNIMMRAEGGQLFLGWAERWDRLDFAHIPVGVLSQAYELYLRSHAPAKQRQEGGFYTPRPIADLLVRASFRALERDSASAAARILDPAAGAGIFLLTAFRELVAARWRADGKRPDTQRLREILYDQITGFDVNEEALRFAALALYLISIELDPQPQPVDKLRFDDLRGKVLHRVGPENGERGSALGSLGPLVGEEHRSRYDMVVGNPPWSTGTKLADWSLVLSTVARIASERSSAKIAPPLPNEGLDLPFVWRAMEWAKPGGQIAFALHARLLFQQGDGMVDARRMLFQALDVTSVINGVELRQTKVWPEIAAPFCLLIATNRVPETGAGFRLISPRLETALNASGTMRIDAHTAEIIGTQQMVETPDILKILFRGTKADLGLIERIRAKGFPTLETFWRDAIGVSDRGRMVGSGQGYQQLRASSSTRKHGDGQPGKDARHLRGLPDVTVESLNEAVVDTQNLQKFQYERVHRLRDARLFDAPVAIVHKSPPADRGRIRVGVAAQPVVYNESFYGYCPNGFAHADVLVRYLTLFFGSKFALWLALITSGEFGFEREVIEKAALDRIPLPDFRKLPRDRWDEILQLFDGLQLSNTSWHDVDRWIADLYGLGPGDLQIISDTLTYNLPFADTKIAAQAPPQAKVTENFCSLLQDELAPWAKRFNMPLTVRIVASRPTSPWIGLLLQVGAGTPDNRIEQDWEALLAIADATAATEMIIEDDSGALLIGRLAQSRYWSKTQAHLLAQHIIWSRLDFLKGRNRG
ncbi:HsdM family class I SAM-dependent methyltransferase [Mesorhizobium sp. L48C026A00]|uniref:HsdM family class I SAM-dependent methyltransferase n=1 Tax=Mesorhizobium sp. L48C026A00 TaxID=1287182 RepID=UPI0003D05874|nr:N-6 DNA methylase [Mesorhizobium sp. L48C026A00]ESZ15221.1 restriction endonuclease subunit M [Mesorhizobium sp. L48C026A00]